MPGLHHGAGFYGLLVPSAFLTDANPVAATATLAVLGVGGVAVPPLAALLIADLARRSRCDRHRMIGPVIGAVAILAAGYAPTLIHQLRNGLPEISGGSPLILRPLVILWRIEVWPISGDVAFAVLGGLPAAIIANAALVAAATGKPVTATQFGRWAVATIIWATGALTFLAPSLAEFTPGMSNDQYHGWLTPVVFAVTGVAKSGAAMAFPLWRDGKPNIPPGAILVVTCDRLFEHSVGMLCGGPAESAIARQAGFSRLVGRF